MRNRCLAAAVAAMAIGLTTPRAHAAITFDPDGAGGHEAFTFGGFDWKEGNALAYNTDGVPLPNQTFDLFYQAQLAAFSGSTGVAYSPSTGTINLGATGGMQISPIEFTIVAGFREVVLPTSTATDLKFGILPNQGPNYVQIYAHAAGTSNNRSGAGFGSDSNGTLILNASLISDGYSSTFTVEDPNGPFTTGTGEAAPYDTGITSVQGNGSTNLRAVVTPTSSLSLGYDPNFFDFGTSGQIILSMIFQTTQSLPFFAVAPSENFFQGAGNPLLPRDIGDYNGSGRDIQFQADASNSFQVAAVPEPGTISLALCGIGLASLGGLRKRFRRDA